MLTNRSLMSGEPQDMIIEKSDSGMPFALDPLDASAFVPPTDELPGADDPYGDDACKLVMANLAAYQDEELDPEQLRIIAVHLDRCASCSAALNTLRTTDELLKREWRESAPLPSSSAFKNSVDAIMGALLPVPVAPTAFAPKRNHARARWTRFATGGAGVLALMGLLWSSYQLGYTRGRLSLLSPSTSSSLVRPPTLAALSPPAPKQ